MKWLNWLIRVFFYFIKIFKIKDGIKLWSDFYMERISKFKSDKDKNYKIYLI